MMLEPEQKSLAVELLKEYIAAPSGPDGRKPMEVQAEMDGERERMIDETLKPLLNGYLEGQVPLAEFKSKIDGLNKRHEYWGFKGIKGQMFFNQIVNVSADPDECD
ncbi:MAG: hypothetical protein HQ581_16090, partial [Planctomycetes bacterium]|nr:hypothetical protein [Planctomycetota bacterium]